jgi:hypothetical protein
MLNFPEVFSKPQIRFEGKVSSLFVETCKTYLKNGGSGFRARRGAAKKRSIHVSM